MPSLAVLGGWFLLLVLAIFPAESFRPLSRPPSRSRSTQTRLCATFNNQNDEPNGESRASVSSRLPFCGGVMEFTWNDGIGKISAAEWDACAVANNDGTRNATSRTTTSPFVEHAWIHSLEESGCACVETGWIPRHLSIRILDSDGNSNETVSRNTSTSTTIDGCVPVYLKTHSMGEFIFDNAWAEAAYRNGLEYFPKLLIGVPFTPVTSNKILWHPRVRQVYPLEHLNGAVASFLKQSALQYNWSTVHVNFCTSQEADILSTYLGYDADQNDPDLCSIPATTATNGDREEGNDENNDIDDVRQRLQALLLRHLRRNDTNAFLRRTSLQYHWKNCHPLRNGQKFRDFEDYLSCFKSKRRINIRRERARARQGIPLYQQQDDLDDDGQRRVRIDAISGADILKVDGLVERMFEIYRSTVDKLYWGRQYLTLEFFQRLCQSSFVHNLCFLCARFDDNKDKTAAVNGGGGDVMVEWKAEDVFAGTFNVVKNGVFYGRYWGCLHEMRNLHFETCYWAAIDYCIENGLERMEPGAGGGDYKWARGFDPQVIHSVHYVRNPWLRRAIFQFIQSETEYHLTLRHELLDRSSVAERENLRRA